MNRLSKSTKIFVKRPEGGEEEFLCTATTIVGDILCEFGERTRRNIGDFSIWSDNKEVG